MHIANSDPKTLPWFHVLFLPGPLCPLPLVTVLPLLRCKMFSFHLHCTVWSQKIFTAMAGSSVLLGHSFYCNPTTSCFSQPAAAGFLPLPCSPLGFLSEPEFPPHSCRSWELLVLPFSCRFFPFQRTWCLRVFCLCSAEPGCSWLRR